MKQVDYQKKRRRAATVIAVVLVLALVLGALAPLLYAVQAQSMAAHVPATQNVAINNTQTSDGEEPSQRLAPEVGLNRFSVNLSVGFDQEYIVGNVTPITGVITNLEDDFEGEICIRMNDSAGSEAESTNYSEYYQKIELQKDGAKQINMVVNFGIVRKSLEFTLKDKQGNVIYLKNIPVKALNPSILAVGVLTENTEGTAYLSALDMSEGSAYSEQYNKTVFFNQNTFPNRVDVLHNLKALIVEDFDTKTLSTEQLNALINFTADGGMLILGTGPNSTKVLGGLKEMVDFQIGENQNISRLSGISDILQTDANKYGQMPITDIKASGLQEIFAEDGKTISSAMNYGSGKIVVHNFALSLKPVAVIPDMVLLLSTIYQNEDPNLFAPDEVVEPIENQLFWMADSFLFLEEKSLMGIFFVIGIYVLLVGPLLYLYLKKKDKREQGWIWIPTMAVACTLGIFLIGSGSSYQNDLLNSVSVTDLPTTGGRSVAHLAASIKSSDKGKVTFQTDNPLQSLNFSGNDSYYYRNWEATSPERRISAAADEGTTVNFIDTQRWKSNNFTASIPQDLGGGFQSTLHYENEGNLKGKLVNNTNLDYTDILVSVNNQFYRFDSLLAGEELSVDVQIDPDNTNFSQGLYDAFNVAEGHEYNVQELIRQGQLTRQEGFVMLQKIRMVEQVYNPDTINNASEGILIAIHAFSDTPVLQGEKLVNGKTPIETHLGLYRSTFVQKWSDLDSFMIPFGMISPQIANESQSSDYSERLYYSDAGGVVQLSFPVPLNVSLNGFTIGNHTDIANFTEEPTIYNFETQAFEPLSFSEYSNTKAYIGDEGRIIIRLTLQPETEIELPSITMKGVGNHAAN